MNVTESRKERTTLYINEGLWKEFRKICAREGVSASNKVEEDISRYVSIHRIGNPQLLMDKYVGKISSKTCYFCKGHFPILKQVRFTSGLVAVACGTCLERPTVQRCIKKVLKVVSSEPLKEEVKQH